MAIKVGDKVPSGSFTVMTGDGQSATANPLRLTRTRTVRGHNEIYVFALPERR